MLGASSVADWPMADTLPHREKTRWIVQLQPLESRMAQARLSPRTDSRKASQGSFQKPGFPPSFQDARGPVGGFTAPTAWAEGLA